VHKNVHDFSRFLGKLKTAELAKLAALKRVLAELVLPGTCGLVAHPCGYRHKARYIAMKARCTGPSLSVHPKVLETGVGVHERTPCRFREKAG
jgi:hypothetical protein